jgi:hypothetical protein
VYDAARLLQTYPDATMRTPTPCRCTYASCCRPGTARPAAT